MTSSQFSPLSAPLAPTGSCEYICLRVRCLDVEGFRAMPTDGKRIWVDDTRNGVDKHSSVGCWLKRWMHCGDRRAVLRRYVTT